MKIQIKEIIQSLEKWAPTAYAESFDNVGLQLGDKEKYIEKALVAFEITEEVLEEAIENQAGLIITFHPLIFGGFKSITGKNRVERVLLRAIKHDIAIYAIHTNLDAQLMGVNHEIGKQLGLNDLKILIPNKETLFKLSFLCHKTMPKKSKNPFLKQIWASSATTPNAVLAPKAQVLLNPTNPQIRIWANPMSERK